MGETDPSDGSEPYDYDGRPLPGRRGPMTSELDPIEPAEAVEFYFDHRAPDLTDSTLYNQRYRLKSFVE